MSKPSLANAFINIAWGVGVIAVFLIIMVLFSTLLLAVGAQTVGQAFIVLAAIPITLACLYILGALVRGLR